LAGFSIEKLANLAITNVKSTSTVIVIAAESSEVATIKNIAVRETNIDSLC